MTKRLYGIVVVIAACCPHSASAGLWAYASALLCGLLAIGSPQAQQAMLEKHAVTLYHGYCFPVTENVSVSPALVQASIRALDLAEIGAEMDVCEALHVAYEGMPGWYEGSENIERVVQMVKHHETCVKKIAYREALERLPQDRVALLLLRGMQGKLDPKELADEDVSILRATGFISERNDRFDDGRFGGLREHLVRCLRGKQSNPTLIGALVDMMRERAVWDEGYGRQLAEL
ncbi:hypothetical protein JW872_03030 [Candidatus Babeliales bacterium]|nr:hypothetical protein [Candidatus Babeliales bacterium]